MFSVQLHRSVYFGALVLLAISLPFSVFTLSVAQITLMVNWLLEGEFRQKWNKVKQHPSIRIIAVLYLVHLLWMANSTDYSYGMFDLRIKLPMLVLPLVIGTSGLLSNSRLRILLNLFVAAIFMATLLCAYNITGYDTGFISTGNDFFPFVSHMRLSLMIVMSIFIVFWLVAQTRSKLSWAYIPLVVWFIFSLVLIKELTGIVIFIIISAFLMIWGIFYYKNFMLRWFLVVSVVTVMALTGSYVTHAYARFHTFDKVDAASLEKYTVNGNPYWHDPNGKLVENGHFVNLYVCESELRKSWNKRSKQSYDGSTLNGGQVKYCLRRYLTSKGLRKDSAGVSKLTDREVHFIEAGVANYIDTVKYGLYPKLYTAFWELYNYKNGANPTGYSISQRFEFLKTAFHIIQHNKWFGVGTGDVQDAFDKQYELDRSPLAMTSRLRAHNQLVTFMVTFGFVGFLLILCSLFLPPFFERKYTNYLFIIIFIIGLLSFLTEDTLETHQGISFFAFFYSLFLFYEHDKTRQHVET
jgi:hypothetical protein